MDGNPIERLQDMLSLEKPTTLIDKYFDLFLEATKDVSNDCFLKGNVLLNKILPDMSRGTKDLDFNVLNASMYNEHVKPYLIKFAESCIASDVATSYTVSDIRKPFTGGVKIYDGNGVIVYSVDVGDSDGLKMGVIKYTFGGNQVLGSDIEHIVCDKCLSTLTRKRFRRMKDFYDLYIISTSKLDVDYSKVYNYMCITLSIDEVKEMLSNYPFSADILVKCDNVWGTFKLHNAFGNTMKKPEFRDMYNSLSNTYLSLRFKAGMLHG